MSALGHKQTFSVQQPMRPCYLKTIIAKIAAPYADRLRLLQLS